MIPEALDDAVSSTSRPLDDGLGLSARRHMLGRSALTECAEKADPPPAWRRTPRVSLIVVLPEGHEIPQAELSDRLSVSAEDCADVIVACAGRPANLQTLQRCVGDAQFLFAPVGTTAEELREMAMQHASGDIVTLVSGAMVAEALSCDAECKSC